MCTALGKINIRKEVVFAISLGSPIGQSILGNVVGDMAECAGKREKIVAIR